MGEVEHLTNYFNKVNAQVSPIIERALQEAFCNELELETMIKDFKIKNQNSL
jgi:hypothetical protein